jgi:hypothetical protein
MSDDISTSLPSTALLNPSAEPISIEPFPLSHSQIGDFEARHPHATLSSSPKHHGLLQNTLYSPPSSPTTSDPLQNASLSSSLIPSNSEQSSSSSHIAANESVTAEETPDLIDHGSIARTFQAMSNMRDMNVEEDESIDAKLVMRWRHGNMIFPFSLIHPFHPQEYCHWRSGGYDRL